MQRKFAVLVLGALLALAVPASAMGSMWPAEHKFEIGTATTPAAKLATSLGSCNVPKISGTIPAVPGNSSTFAIATPSVNSCTAGTSVTLSGEWKFNGTVVAAGTGVIVFRYSSLPGCKLSSNSVILSGVWSNGYTTHGSRVSTYYPDAVRTATWANDGSTCALAGKTEQFSWESRQVSVSGSGETKVETRTPLPVEVTNLTSAGTPILLES